MMLTELALGTMPSIHAALADFITDAQERDFIRATEIDAPRTPGRFDLRSTRAYDGVGMAGGP